MTSFMNSPLVSSAGAQSRPAASELKKEQGTRGLGKTCRQNPSHVHDSYQSIHTFVISCKSLLTKLSRQFTLSHFNVHLEFRHTYQLWKCLILMQVDRNLALKSLRSLSIGNLKKFLTIGTLLHCTELCQALVLHVKLIYRGKRPTLAGEDWAQKMLLLICGS